MFGELIEKAQKLVMNVMRVSEIRSRKRARFQVVGALLAGVIAMDKHKLGSDPELRKDAIQAAVQMAQELESFVYAESSPEEDFDSVL